ncbi:hypothetical protein LPJ61_001514 [Coemansia biformis]|uniref:DUS-like FMN-binding domain-containing protein n=1 Tax=Coemansia biformis TaxID=1286918 RepID=A0A9W8CX81_9FUNG|nr:hypothetical protein LPJ61_001514 [Coemansia biformis]
MAAAVARQLRTSVAPMVDVTDPCFLRLLRLISPFGNHQLWTEMVHANAFSRGQLHQNPAKLAQHIPLRELQDFAPHVVVQIGASAPDDAHAAVGRLAELGVRHVNLNCGCPSRNVQMGSFGAVLMKSPGLAAEIIGAMRDAARGSTCEVSVKCRIGIDDDESSGFLRRFIAAVADQQCSDAARPARIVLHARRAWLSGLSPKQNRKVPELNHQRVHEMVREFPHVSFVVNGGIDSVDAVRYHLARADGVMLGRKIREDPWFLAQLDQHVYGAPQHQIPSAAGVLAQYIQFADQMHSQYGTRYTILARPLYALFSGRRARAMRTHLGAAISRATAVPGADGSPTYAVPFGILVQDALRSAELEFRMRVGMLEPDAGADIGPREPETKQPAVAC